MEFWLRERSLESIVIVVTDGWLEWDDKVNDFDARTTNAIPPLLHKKYGELPLFADFRKLRTSDALTLDNEDFVHAVAPIAARLHNKTVKELFGQVALQHRNRLRVRNTVIFVLSVLTVASCAASFIAWRNFTESRSNELAAYSSQWLSRDPTIAFRLAEQGNVM